MCPSGSSGSRGRGVPRAPAGAGDDIVRGARGRRVDAARALLREAGRARPRRSKAAGGATNAHIARRRARRAAGCAGQPAVRCQLEMNGRDSERVRCLFSSGWPTRRRCRDTARVEMDIWCVWDMLHFSYKVNSKFCVGQSPIPLSKLVPQLRCALASSRPLPDPVVPTEGYCCSEKRFVSTETKAERHRGAQG